MLIVVAPLLAVCWWWAATWSLDVTPVCYPSVSAALAAGDAEDAACASWLTPAGEFRTGPLWLMGPGDERVN